MQLNSSDLDLNQQPVGVRFTGLAIPPGATITNAYLALTAEDTNTDTASVTVFGEASDDAVTFTTANSNITGRPTTASSVNWALPPWTGGQVYQTPDIAAIIQEIVNRPGWASGNSLVIVLTTGPGERDAVAYDQNDSAAPFLHVEFTADNSSAFINNQSGAETTAVTNNPNQTTSALTPGQKLVNGVAQLWSRFTATFGIVRN